jgi:hypothetical protein
VLLLVKENIGIFVFLKLEIALQTFILTAKPILFNSRILRFFNELVVEAIPLVLRLDEGVVVPAL